MTTSKIDLPDVEDMMGTIDEIYAASLRKTSLEVELKFQETLISKEANSNEKYFKAGKPLSQSTINSTYTYGGFEGELIPKRKELAEVTARVEFLKNKLELMKEMIGIWRTQQASERTSTF
jgi:hypothetical protein